MIQDSIVSTRKLISLKNRNIYKATKILSSLVRHVKLANKMEKRDGALSKEGLDMITQSWAKECLNVFEFEVTKIGNPIEETAVFVGNHISYVDIPLVMSQAHVTFVAKHDVAYWPIIGAGCRRADVVFVKRSSKNSRYSAGEQVAKYLRETKRSVTIFPSGTTCLDESLPWRMGSFRIAKDANVPIQPFRISYSHLRKVAYIDKDTLVPHALSLMKTKNLKATIEFGTPFYVTDPEAQCEWTRLWCGHKDAQSN